ncbi:unnamed protein product, partial [Rotaria magnacalcarata]
MFSYVAPRKPRINHRQQYSRLQWCYQHLSWAENDWSNVIFTDERPIVFYDGSLNSDKYIDILDQHLPTAYEKFLPQSPRKILLQQGNARPHVSIKSRKYLKKKKINPIPWSANSADLNLLENIWSILDDKLLKYNINNT